MNPLDLVGLPHLMKLTGGQPEIAIGLIDGPVFVSHPDFADANLREIGKGTSAACTKHDSFACLHGTFIAGILSARRGSISPALCPGCTLLIRPVFPQTNSKSESLPAATPQEIAEGILDCIGFGARLINLSLGLSSLTSRGERELEEALDYAAKRGVIVVAAAGNQGKVGSSAITRHPWVIPVAAYDRSGRPMSLSNIGSSIGRQGIGAPGDDISGLGINGHAQRSWGTSVAAAFVTGTIALLWSLFPHATPVEVKSAMTGFGRQRRATVIPPLLNAEDAYRTLAAMHERIPAR